MIDYNQPALFRQVQISDWGEEDTGELQDIALMVSSFRWGLSPMCTKLHAKDSGGRNGWGVIERL